MRIAVFGGAFDPPHVGHTAIAQYLIDSHQADCVWFLPVKVHHFGKQVTAPAHRLAMLEAIVGGNEDIFKINTYELDETPDREYNKTYLTLKYFKRTYLDDEFSFVIGADNLTRFDEWDYYQELLHEFPILVYPRQGFDFNPMFPGMIALTKAPMVTTSSTAVREAIRAGKPITELVLPAVARYIKAHQLYAS